MQFPHPGTLWVRGSQSTNPALAKMSYNHRFTTKSTNKWNAAMKLFDTSSQITMVMSSESPLSLLPNIYLAERKWSISQIIKYDWWHVYAHIPTWPKSLSHFPDRLGLPKHQVHHSISLSLDCGSNCLLNIYITLGQLSLFSCTEDYVYLAELSGCHQHGMTQRRKIPSYLPAICQRSLDECLYFWHRTR